MRTTVHGLLILLLVIGVVFTGPQARAGEEESEGVAKGTIAFEAGTSVPEIEHRFIKIRSLDTTIGEPNPKTGKQKISMKVIVDNFGEKDHKVIITVSLLDADDKIIATKTVKDDIDDNDNETFKLKLALLREHVDLVENVRLEVSYLKD